MRRLNQELIRLMKDEQGGDAIEYALVSGLIVILFLAAFVQLTENVGSTFNTVGNAIEGA